MIQQTLSNINAGQLWLYLLKHILSFGHEVTPRGQKTLEVMNHSYKISPWQPVITVPERKLNYRFMAAEPMWIIRGDDKVETIAKYNSAIAKYASGDRFFGAYGPKYVKQFDYVINKLLKDRDTRQAVMTFWTECPPDGVDVACNDLLVFSIRDDKLHLHVTARSKDVWLGLPYDIFGFSMMMIHAACWFNRATLGPKITLGYLTFTDISLHLYEQHWEEAKKLVDGGYSIYSAFGVTANPGPVIKQDGLLEGNWLYYLSKLSYAAENKGVMPFEVQHEAQ